MQQCDNRELEVRIFGHIWKNGYCPLADNVTNTSYIVSHPDAFVFQLLRRLLDDRIICTLQKPFEWRSVEGLSVMSAMDLSEYHSIDNAILHPRLLVEHSYIYSLEKW